MKTDSYDQTGGGAMAPGQITARGEWRAYPMLPVAGALGYATSVIHIYSLGPLIAPISEAFGWSRTQVTTGLTISTLLQAVFSVPVGLLVDKFGPRRFALVGIILTCAAFALLSLADGTKANWYLLWLVMAAGVFPVQATVWTSAVASRFKSSRGLALAVTLCGASVAATLFPPLTAWLAGTYGWKSAFLGLSALWLVIAWPPIFLFFRGANDVAKEDRAAQEEARQALAGVALRDGLRSSVYLRLFGASALFTFAILALVVHFVPILTDRGANPIHAAGVASLIGIFSVIGRLATGMLLDRFSGSLVGSVVFALPAVAGLMLLFAGDTVAGQVIAASFIGLTLGAEIDVIVFLTAQHFGLRNFGGLYGGLLAALSCGTALGPLAASAVYDQTGSYAPYLWLTIALMVISSAALASLPRPAYRGH
jgi:MFS family permease